MEELLERMLEECRHFAGQGRVADYIPELAEGDPAALGVYIIGSEGRHSWAGDCRQPFTLDESEFKQAASYPMLPETISIYILPVFPAEHRLDVVFQTGLPITVPLP